MKDITGERFGKLTVISKHHLDKRQEWHWECKCDCGNTTIVTGNKLRSGHTKSCGCMLEEHRSKGFHKTHGLSETKLYTVWLNMKHRCYYKRNNMYYAYGGRGISVCDEWMKFEVFADWAFSNGYEEGLSLERIDVNGNYCPENCKWIPMKKQYLNRTDSHLLTAFGETMTIKEWSDRSGIKYDTIERRINAYGWTPEDAVTKKPNKKC